MIRSAEMSDVHLGAVNPERRRSRLMESPSNAAMQGGGSQSAAISQDWLSMAKYRIVKFGLAIEHRVLGVPRGHEP